MQQRLPFHRQLKLERESRGWSQEDLAARIGKVSKKTVGRWEKGESLPQPYYRQKITELLSKSLEELGWGEQSAQPEQVSESSPLKEDWGEAPLGNAFYGRDVELAELQEWIAHKRCRVVAVVGIGGIGKTSLAAATAMHVKESFTAVFWRSLHNAPPLEHLLQQCLQILFPQIQPVPASNDDLLPRLLHHLQANRCLLVLDNFESLLQPGQNTGSYREGYEPYGRLLQLLGETEHRSCLLLTSREKPREMASLEGRTAPAHTLHVQGVGQGEGKEILQDRDIFGSDKSWTELVHLYSGNPLALKLVSESIEEVFGGEIESFLKDEEIVFGNINELVDEQFRRLSILEQEVLYWLAIEREAVPLEEIRDNFAHPVPKRIFVEVLASLRRRSLIETRDPTFFTLQPVIMEYVTTRLVERAVKDFRKEPDAESSDVWMNFALTKAQTKEYVRASQARLILAPITKQLLHSLGREALEHSLKLKLSALRQIYPQSEGYLAGNILNLLIHLGSDLPHFDFSHLTIRQAYLQNVVLPAVNFSHAHFVASVFTNAFGNILSVAFSSDGNLLAAGTATGEISIYQASTGMLLQTFKEHRDAVWSLDFHPKGHLLISSSDDQTIRIWDVHSGYCWKTLQDHTNRVRSAVLSPDGKTLASGSDDQTVRLRNSQTGECLNILPGHSDRIWSVAFSPDGCLLATGSTDRTIRLWDVTSGRCLKILPGHTSWVWSVIFSPDGYTLASASADQTVRLWDVTTGDCLRVLEGHQHEVRSVCFNPDGDILASASEDQTIRLWDVTTGSCSKVLKGHQSGVRAVCFHPHGNTLVSGGDDQTVRFWEVAKGQGFKTLQGHTNRVWTAVLSPDGQTLASSHEGGTIRLWHIDTQKCFKTLQDQTHAVRATAFHPNGHLLVSGGEDQTVRLWNTSTGNNIKTLWGHTRWIRSVAFRPDGRMFASGGEDNTVRLWDVDTGQCLRCLDDHTHWVRAVAWSRDGSLLASSSDDQTIRIWNPDTGHCLSTLQGHSNRVRAAAFHPDGRSLASGSEDQSVRVWDLKTGQCLQILTGHTHRVLSVAFSPGGELLASGSEDHTIRLWKSDTGECLDILQGHTQRVRWVTFAPAGSPLVSCSDDGTIKLWEVKDRSRDGSTCIATLISGLPYEGMNITKAQGLTDAQKLSLLALGAVDDGATPLSID
jgi:WD40 repeat protein/transcriptional regulator with XRE-family HTH domain